MRAFKTANGALCVSILCFLVLPIFAVVPLSFSSGTFVSYPLPGVSLRWYGEVFGSTKWLSAFGNSIYIGLISTLISVVLGVLTALGLAGQRWWWASTIKSLMLAPMIFPIILIAVAIYYFFARIGLVNTFTGMILAHAVISIPFVIIPVLTSLEQLDKNLLRAAASCGATPAVAFFKVTVPSIAPAVASGALFAFGQSFDDVVIALFIAGPYQRTLPREMFSGIREAITPELTAVATLLIIFTTLLFVMVQSLQRSRREQLRRSSF